MAAGTKMAPCSGIVGHLSIRGAPEALYRLSAASGPAETNRSGMGHQRTLRELLNQTCGQLSLPQLITQKTKQSNLISLVFLKIGSC